MATGDRGRRDNLTGSLLRPVRVAFVLNPAARSGRAARHADRIRRDAAAAGLDASLVLTAGPGDATTRARELAADHEAVIAVGGDGTAQEVINGLVDTDAAFGLVPVGTGNDLAAALGIPTGVELGRLAAELRAPARHIDLARATWTEAGETHSRVYANSLGAGFDALAASLAGRYKRFGATAGYLVAIGHALKTWTPDAAEVEVFVARGDGTSESVLHGPFFLCEIANGRSVAGGIRLTPEAELDDGLLDVCCAGPLSMRRVVRVLPKALAGRHTREPEVSMRRGPAARIHALRGSFPIHADGEALATAATHLAVEVLPGALRVLGDDG